MPFNLPAMARAQGRRRNITLRPLIPTKAMETELAGILVRAANHWASATESILAGFDPAPLQTGDTLTLDSPAQVQASVDATAADFLHRVLVDITLSLKRWTVRAEQIHRDKWAAAVKAGTSVDLSHVLTVFGTEDTLAAFIARNVALAKNISDQAEARISDAVWRGYQNRTPVRDVAKEIREATDMGRARATRIAADQSVKLWAALDVERHAEAGIEWFKWRHSGKVHYRSWHRARDGKIYNLFTREARGGGETIPADDMCGMPPWCACRAQAWLSIEEEL